MQIEKTTTVTFSPDDIEMLITQHLKSKGLNPHHIRFDIEGEYENNGDQFKTYRLESITCECKD